MDGTSFAHTFSDAPAGEERHTVQYFEMVCSRAIYKDGWWACTKLDKLPWDFSPATLARFAPGSGWDPKSDVWELYYLPDDFSQAHNIAADNTRKGRRTRRAVPGPRPSATGCCRCSVGSRPSSASSRRCRPGPGSTSPGTSRTSQTTMIPRIVGRSYAIEADVRVPEGGAEGVLVAFADFIGGFALWVDEKGLLNHTYQFLGVDTYRQTSTEPIPTGDVTLKMVFDADQATPGTGGHVTLWAGDRQIGEGEIPRTISLIFTTYAGMDIGRDNGGVVDLDYEDKAAVRVHGHGPQRGLRPRAHADRPSRSTCTKATAQAALAHGAAG